jgi:glycosyltransferase involved in cell wall biosynthesis
VTTAVSDGTPVSLLEAMSSGLPCIATAVGGVPEWITDGENGILIQPRNPDMLADRMLMLATDAEMRRRFGAAARETVVERADWKRLMAAAESDYTALVMARRGNNREKTCSSPQ